MDTGTVFLNAEEPMAPAGGKMNHASLKTLLGGLRHDLYHGKPPVEYRVAAQPWGSVGFRPGEIMAVAAPPAMGKTALISQMTVDALRLDPAARCLTVNVEMRPEVIIERQISRLSGVPYSDIAGRKSLLVRDKHIDPALSTLDSIGDRMFFMQPPFSIERVVKTVDEVGATILVLDYLQRIQCCDGAADARNRLNSLMDTVREIANCGVCVVLISAVARTPSKKGGGYNANEIGMGSFRESSEIEYGCDDAFVLVEGNGSETTSGSRVLELRHVKSRNHERKNLGLLFEGGTQRFRLAPSEASPPPVMIPDVALAKSWQERKRSATNFAGDPFLEGLGEGK
jgi:replicative DNA helicase